MERAKPWSVSAALRGFYDSNYNTAPSDSPAKRHSWGFEVAPTIGVNLPLEQTFISLNYTYSLRWYEDRDDKKYDQSHIANLVITHAFTDALKLDLKDSFVVAQEPEVLAPGTGGIALPVRSEGNNVRNRGDLTLTAQLSRQFSIAAGYGNGYYDYEQDGPGSYSALLDRMEHYGHVDFNWHATPDLTGFVGYEYQRINYHSSDSLLVNVPLIPQTNPRIRDSQNHITYVGANYNFSNQLVASLRGGAQYRIYDDRYTAAYPTADDSDVTPYGELNVTYTYLQGSYLQGGVRHAKVQTDVVDPTLSGVTQDQDATTIWAVLNHKITSQLSANALAQVQLGKFHGGGADGEMENIYLLGLNLSYQLNQFLGFEAGYNFDRLDSDLAGRSYSRNRGYVGVRGTY